MRRLMHRRPVVQEALALIEQGVSDQAIARTIGVPRRTIADWRRGKNLLRLQRTACGVDHHAPLPEDAYGYLLGMYLGDGCLSPCRAAGVWRLRIFADAKYPAIVRECASAMEAIFPTKHANVQRRHDCACLEISMYARHWLCLFPQHGRGRKHMRKIGLAPWQRAIVEADRRPFLRGLIHSDGCRIIATEKQAGRVRHAPRYLFTNVSQDILGLFCESCDALGIRWTRPNSKTIAIYRLASVELMDAFIGPKL